MTLTETLGGSVSLLEMVVGVCSTPHLILRFFPTVASLPIDRDCSRDHSLTFVPSQTSWNRGVRMNPAHSMLSRTHSSMVLRLVIWTFLLTCGLGCHSRVPLSPLEQAEKVLQSGDFKSAKTLAKAIPREHPQWADAQVMIGGIETTYRYAGAGLPYYESVPRDGSPVSMKAIRAIAEIHLKLGALEKSAMNFRDLLEQHPEDRFARRKLATILADTGQRFEAETELLELGKRVPMEIKEVVLLTEPDRPASPSTFLRQCAQANARDPFVNFGLAVEEVAAQNFDDARKRLGLVIETNPEFTAAHALSGELALDVGLAELQAWNKKLPASAQNDPGVWFVRGLWARQLHQDRVAARCLWETIRQRPHHRRALFHLGQVMTPLKRGPSPFLFLCLDIIILVRKG